MPITLHPDGRKSHAPHLKTFRDGWRTLRFLPDVLPALVVRDPWRYVNPFGFDRLRFGHARYEACRGSLRRAHLLFASLAILCGYQSILFAVFTKTFAIGEGLMPEDPFMTRFYEIINLERGLIVAGTAMLVGLLLLMAAVKQWWLVDFGPLDYGETMRLVVPGVTLTALGFQTVFSSFFVSILGMRRQ